MEVILLEKHSKLGDLGDITNVKNGYARNFLIPQNKAIRATKENKKIFEARRSEIQKEIDEKISIANAQYNNLSGKNITIIKQASDDGKLYGSVNANVIANAINKEFGLQINKLNITTNEQVKFIGEYKIKVSLYADVTATIRLIVARSEEEAQAMVNSSNNKNSEKAND